MPAKKAPTPALPTLRLELVPVTTPMPMQGSHSGKIQHDVIARDAGGKQLKRWAWWQADKPRSRRARYMQLDGVRYEVARA